MDSFDEFYDAAKEFDDFLKDQEETLEDSYLLGQSVLMYHGEKSGLDLNYRDTDDFDIATPDINTVRNLGNYGMFYSGESNIPFENFNVDILSNPSHPTISELEEDWHYGDEVLDEFNNMELRVMSPELFYNSKIRMAEEVEEREKDWEDAEKMKRILNASE